MGPLTRELAFSNLFIICLIIFVGLAFVEIMKRQWKD